MRLFSWPFRTKRVWRASLGWREVRLRNVAHTWDETAEFDLDDFDGAQHWLRCKIEDCTRYSYQSPVIVPNREYELNTQLGQVFRIRKVRVPANANSAASS